MTTIDDNFVEQTYSLPADQAESLLRDIAHWGKLTTIIIHGGCVFEFKGNFPKGFIAEGFYNLDSGQSGFEGHIRLSAIESITLQSKRHRGRPSYSFVFASEKETIFKVFLGRNENGEIFPDQLIAFNKISAAAIKK